MTLSEDVLAIEAAMQTILDTILDHHTTTLTAAWSPSWACVAGVLEAVLLELAEDGDVPGWRIEKSRRAQQGLAAAGRALEDLAELTGTTISDDAARALGLGVDGEIAMIGAQLPPGHSGVVRVDDAQIAARLGRTTQQITAVSWPISAETLAAIQAELARGMIVGDNPREAARRMLAATEGRFTGGLTRALNISRTEMLDAMRTAQHAADQVNAETLAGWTWGAHLDSRTCISCISMHGTEWPLEEPGPIDHQSGGALVCLARSRGRISGSRTSLNRISGWSMRGSGSTGSRRRNSGRCSVLEGSMRGRPGRSRWIRGRPDALPMAGATRSRPRSPRRRRDGRS